MTYETWVKDFQEKNNRLPYADEVFEAGKKKYQEWKKQQVEKQEENKGNIQGISLNWIQPSLFD